MPDQTLDDIGIRHGVKQASGARDLLRQHEQELRSSKLEITDIVLILGVDAVGTATTFAEFLPTATIHLLSVNPLGDRAAELAANVRYEHCASITGRIAYLKACPRPQLIIENGNNRKGQKLACFRQLMLFLPPGGSYVVEELKAVTIDKLNDCRGDNIVELLNRLNLLRSGVGDAEEPSDVELANSIDSITFGDNVAYIRKRHDHRVKLRDAEANAVLTARFGTSWGTVLQTLPAHEFPSAARVTNHGAGPLKTRKMIKVPDRHLRQYEQVVCQPRQRLVYGGYFLPDTFRHPLQSRLNHRGFVNPSPHLDRSEREPQNTEQLDGRYFYFDTEYPGHFGHVTTEVLGRYWGWTAARAIDPAIRPLISLDSGQDGIPGFQKLIFEALDVPVPEIAYIRPNTNVRVESLIAATPAFAMPQYADNSLAQDWARIAAKLGAADAEGPELIFSSRRPRRIRSCLNTDQVEDFFADLGFTIIYPEDHPFPEQVRLFSGARVIAGFGGSNLFCTMFAPGATKIIISGHSYTANNEQLIGSVVGGELHNVWGRSEVNHPPRGWSWPAFQSNFTVDLQKHGDAIRAIVGA